MSAQVVKVVAFKVSRLKQSVMDPALRSIIEALVDAQPRSTDIQLEKVRIDDGWVYGFYAGAWHPIEDRNKVPVTAQYLRIVIDEFAKAAKLDGAERQYLKMLVDTSYFNS